MESVALMQATDPSIEHEKERLRAGIPAVSRGLYAGKLPAGGRAWWSRLVGAVCLVWATAGTAWGAPPVEPPGPRNYLQRSYTKIRPGSMLRGENGAPIALPPDLRSAAGKRRDQHVLKHFARLAELDMIDDIAEKRKDVSLQENVEEVRRKEMERFHALMQELRSVSWRTWLGELP